MIRITYIISSIDKALEFEQVAQKLDKEQFELSFILMNPGASTLENFIREHAIPVYRVKYRGKKDLPLSVIRILYLLKKIKPQIVHTHLFDASLAGLTAAWLLGIKRRISTRHHSDYHHTYFPNAVKYDKLNNRLSTELIAISNVVKKVLITKEHVSEKKISIVHHGVEIENFEHIDISALDHLRKKYNPNGKQPVIGVISRYIELKGIQYIIPAFKKLLVNYPDALLILANAKGDYSPEIKSQLRSIPERSYKEIDFEKDICSLYKLFNIFVHVPTSTDCEAFGQIYIESLASGIPSVFTLSGIANEFIVNEKNALVVNFKDPEALFNALEKILNNGKEISEMIQMGKNNVAEQFSVGKKIYLLEQIYLKQK